MQVLFLVLVPLVQVWGIFFRYLVSRSLSHGNVRIPSTCFVAATDREFLRTLFIVPTEILASQLSVSQWQSMHSAQLITAAEVFLGHEVLEEPPDDASPAMTALVSRILLYETAPLVGSGATCSAEGLAAAKRFWVWLASKGEPFEEARRMEEFVGRGHEYMWVHAVYPILLAPYAAQDTSNTSWLGSMNGGYRQLGMPCMFLFVHFQVLDCVTQDHDLVPS